MGKLRSVEACTDLMAVASEMYSNAVMIKIQLLWALSINIVLVKK